MASDTTVSEDRPADSDEAAFDRADADRWARDLRRRLEDLLRAAKTSRERLEDDLQQARLEHRAERRRERFASISIEDGRRGNNIEVAPLRAAGITTAFDVYQRTEAELDAAGRRTSGALPVGYPAEFTLDEGEARRLRDGPDRTPGYAGAGRERSSLLIPLNSEAAGHRMQETAHGTGSSTKGRHCHRIL
jgi:hypothetical protein